VAIANTNDISPYVNNPDKAAFAAEGAKELVGADALDTDLIPRVGGGDFSFFWKRALDLICGWTG